VSRYQQLNQGTRTEQGIAWQLILMDLLVPGSEYDKAVTTARSGPMGDDGIDASGSEVISAKGKGVSPARAASAASDSEDELASSGPATAADLAHVSEAHTHTGTPAPPHRSHGARHPCLVYGTRR
jgi:hypothetical protein